MISTYTQAGGRPGVGMAGGCSWTANWLHFDNSYYKRMVPDKTGGNSGIGPEPGLDSLSSSPHRASSMPNNINNIHTRERKKDTHIHSHKSTPTKTHNTHSTNNNSNTNNTSNSSSSDDTELLWLPTDNVLYTCSEFRIHFIKYAKDQSLWYLDYMYAHIKMSELGAKFEPKKGIILPCIDINKYINN